MSNAPSVSYETIGMQCYVAELERRVEDAASIMDMVLSMIEADSSGTESRIYGAIHGALDILLNAQDYKPD